MDREFLAVLDGTLAGPDALFRLKESYLRELKITQADRIVFVADGARWIWNRVASLSRRLEIKADRVEELVDFYHAVEHLGDDHRLATAVVGAKASGVDPPPGVVTCRRGT